MNDRSCVQSLRNFYSYGEYMEDIDNMIFHIRYLNLY